jgi:putative RNA 2'-phosphotransferase
MLKHQPKTLAKTLDYMVRRSPGEHGLFWDPDGAMPWKDLYWAMQQDPSLRFVREPTIREIELLGIELPFYLDGNLLRLRPEFGPPVYEPAAIVPQRLYFGLKPKHLVHVQKIGLSSTRRRFVALCANRDLALKFAARTEASPILLEIFAGQASENGLPFLDAGGDLYLTDRVPVEFILFPKVRQDLVEKLAAPPIKPKNQPASSASAGTFIVKPQHLQTPGSGEQPGKTAKTNARDGWKKERRKERHKRDIR